MLGLYGDNGKENGSYFLGLKVYRHGSWFKEVLQ